MALTLPDYAHIVRTLKAGLHPYVHLLPRASESPALHRIAADPQRRQFLLERAQVRIDGIEGYAWVDETVPCIVLADWYYRDGEALDLYLDLLHELTHIRQHFDGHDLWDERFPYVDRLTEIEGYAIAVEEGRRIGLTDEDVVRHLSNPWMSEADVQRLIGNVEGFLRGERVGEFAARRMLHPGPPHRRGKPPKS